MEGQGGAIGGLEAGGGDERVVVGGADEVEAGAEDGGRGGGFFAAGRVEGEFGPVGVGADVADVELDAVDYVGDRVRAGGVEEDFAGFGVDVDREADDDGADVEGADDAGGDRDEGDGVAVVGPGEVDLAGGVGERVDQRRTRQVRVSELERVRPSAKARLARAKGKEARGTPGGVAQAAER